MKAIVIRDFKDAGTGARFKKGDQPDLKAGVFANYETAGLVRFAADDAEKAKAPVK